MIIAAMLVLGCVRLLCSVKKEFCFFLIFSIQKKKKRLWGGGVAVGENTHTCILKNRFSPGAIAVTTV